MTKDELIIIQEALALLLQTKQKQGEKIDIEYKSLFFKITAEAAAAAKRER